MRSAEEHASFQSCVATSKPINVPGRMDTAGSEPRSDPMLTGELKDGVDYTRQSIIAVGGRQCRIERVQMSEDGSTVTAFCKHDEDQMHGREYCAVVVEPAVGADVELVCEVVGAAPMVMQSAMVFMPMGPPDFEQRPEGELQSLGSGPVTLDGAEVGGTN